MATIASSVLVATGLSAAASSARPARLDEAATRPGVAAPASVVWRRLNGGSTSATEVGAELGLTRTSDGVLHVIWNRGSSESDGTTKIFQTRVSPAGTILAASTVASGWTSLAGGLALAAMPDRTLRLFVSGQSGTKAASGINMFTAPASASSFTLDGGHVWGGEVAGASPYIAATVSHGQIVTAWAGSYNVGLAPTASNQYPTVHPSMSVPQLSADAKTGAVVFSGLTNYGKAGVFVQQVLPRPGPGALLSTGDNGVYGVFGATARLGAGGVYVLTADDQAKVLALARYGGGKVVVARGASYYYCGVVAAPGGRLWIVWYPGSGTDLFVTRSNGAVTKFESHQTLPLPAGASLNPSPFYGNGSAGPIDLFARMSVGNVSGFLFTHVLAIMNVTSAVVPITSKKGKVIGKQLKVFVTDAGDPVPGATVAVGQHHATTKAFGAASFSYPGSPTGPVTVTVTAPGYYPVTASASL
jgi:hypothetical protein